MPGRPAPHFAQIGQFYDERLATPAAERAAPSRLASDYPEAQLATLPPEVVGSSFGCGNPTAVAGVKPGDTVLDLGCGAGIDLMLAAEKVGATGHVIGIDVNPNMVFRAREAAAKMQIPNIEVFEGQIESLPVETGTVDWVISNCVINLSMDKSAVFREITRVLKPGGQALIADLVAQDLPEWILEHSDLYAACIAGALSQSEYCRLALEAGLSDARVVDTMAYDRAMVRQLLDTELPVALDEIAARLGITRSQLLVQAAGDLSEKITAIKLYAKVAGD